VAGAYVVVGEFLSLTDPALTSEGQRGTLRKLRDSRRVDYTPGVDSLLKRLVPVLAVAVSPLPVLLVPVPEPLVLEELPIDGELELPMDVEPELPIDDEPVDPPYVLPVPLELPALNPPYVVSVCSLPMPRRSRPNDCQAQ
jgi:hypothetical protein